MQINASSVIIIEAAALLGSTLAGTTGFGGAAVLLPVLVHFFGVRDAVPILTVAQLIGNGSRVYLHRTALNWKVIKYFSLGAIPLTLVGGYLFAHAPLQWLLPVLGMFLLAMVAWRWLRWKLFEGMSARRFVGVGAVSGLLSAIVGSVGPFIVPFFLSFGLVKSAFIGTEAMATVVMHVFKLIAYDQAALLPSKSVLIGLGMGPVMVVGTWMGKQIVQRVSDRVFVILVEITLVIAGLKFLFSRSIF